MLRIGKTAYRHVYRHAQIALPDHLQLVVALDLQSHDRRAVFADRHVLIRKSLLILRQQDRAQTAAAADRRNEQMILFRHRIILTQNGLQFRAEQIDPRFRQFQQIAVVFLGDLLETALVHIGRGIFRVGVARAQHTAVGGDDVGVGVDQLAHDQTEIRIGKLAGGAFTEHPVHFSDFL